MAKGLNQAAIPFLELGFRPLFFVAGCSAVIFMICWLVEYSTALNITTGYGTLLWHSHEMIFGYTAAVLAGFLLTAVRNWTGVQTVQNAGLAALVTVWLLARVMPFVPGLSPPLLIAVVDIAFLPLVALLIALPILKAKAYKNLMFVALLLLMAVANLFIHLQLLGYTTATAAVGIRLALNLVVLVMVIIGGRIIPFFSQRVLAVDRVAAPPWINNMAIGSVVVFALADSLSPSSLFAALFAGFALAANGLRLAHWYGHAIWRVPLLWVLYLAYAWLIVGFGLSLLCAAGLFPKVLATHAFTVGGIGVMTLGMMSRVALGHTGRALRSSTLTVYAYVLINLAVVVRVVLPMLFPQTQVLAVQLAGLLWIAAFTFFMIVYMPILVKPRLDQQSLNIS